MYSDWITSLCYISTENGKTKELCRIADYYNGGYEEYGWDPDKTFYGTDRDLIYGSYKDITGEVGSIGVYEWSVEQQNDGKWWTITRESDEPWIEVLTTFYDSPFEIIEKIKSGIKLTLHDAKKHDIIFCCTAKGPNVEAIYVPANSLVNVNDRYTFAEDVISLELSKFNFYEDTATCRCRYNPNATSRYLIRPKSWRATSTIMVRSVQEIVVAAVSTYARQLDKDRVISRKERQSFNSVINKLSSEAISDEVMEKLGCSREEALSYIDECLNNLSNRLNSNEVDWVIQHLIENDSEYSKRMLEEVELKWRSENEATLIKADEEINKRKQDLADLISAVETANEQLQYIQCEKDKKQEELDFALQLKRDVEKEIKEKIESIRSDRAKALVDEAWTMAAIGPNQASTDKRRCAWSFEYDGNCNEVEEVTLSHRWFDAVETWGRVCANEGRGTYLAAFFLGAYAVRQHLLISGECAEQVADIAAEIVTGRTCLKVYVDDMDSIPDVIREISAVPHDYICFPNGLEQNQTMIKAIMKSFSDSHFIITTPYYESLVMEPASMYTTFFPVCTEEFCVNTRILEHDAVSCKKDLRSSQYTQPGKNQIRTIRSKQIGWFSDGFFMPMLIERCARLHYAIWALLTSPSANSEEQAMKTMLSMVYVPLLRCMRRKDIISANIGEFDVLDEPMKSRLLAFAGVE